MRNNNDGFDFGRSIESGVDRTIGLLPEILGAILLVVIGWFFASIVRKLVKGGLRRIRFDRAVHTSPGGNIVSRIIEHPSNFLGQFAYWVVFLAFISFAISALDVPALNAIVVGIYSYIPNVIAAILIFLVASAVSVAGAGFVQRVLGSNPLSRMVSAVIPALTMGIAVFMILNQLKIAEDIVNITYTAIMGSLALGLALAFGLGGRDVAGRILEQAYESTQRNKANIKAEVSRAAKNAKREAQRAKDSRESEEGA